MTVHDSRPSPGEMVSLTSLPPGLVDGLPQEDQDAIVAIVGKPVLLVGYDEDGRAELHFDDPFERSAWRVLPYSLDLGGPRVHRTASGLSANPKSVVKRRFATAASTAGCTPPPPTLFGP